MDKLGLLPDHWRAGIRAARRTVVDTGLMRSVKEGRAVDSEGRPVPWYTYPAIAYLDRLDLAGRSVFEWGVGASTLYWERRGCKVVGVEDSAEWHAKVVAESDAHCILATRQDEYVHAPVGTKSDLVCIDGKHRDLCAALAPTVVADDGLIIFDNSDRHPDALRRLRAVGWIQVDFFGLGPLNPFPTSTSLLFHGSLAIPHPDLPPADY